MPAPKFLQAPAASKLVSNQPGRRRKRRAADSWRKITSFGSLKHNHHLILEGDPLQKYFRLRTRKLAQIWKEYFLLAQCYFECSFHKIKKSGSDVFPLYFSLEGVFKVQWNTEHFLKELPKKQSGWEFCSPKKSLPISGLSITSESWATATFQIYMGKTSSKLLVLVDQDEARDSFLWHWPLPWMSFFTWD